MTTVNVSTQGYFPTATAGAAGPTPVVVNVGGAPSAPAAPSAPVVRGYGSTTDTYAATTVGGNALLPTSGAAIAGTVAKAVPAGGMAAVGAAQAIARNSSAAMGKEVARVIGDAGAPLLKFSWGLVSNVAEFAGNLLTFQFGKAITSFSNIFKEGAVNIGQAAKKLVQPASLTAATSGGTRLGLGGAISTGLSTGLKALKSSALWAIPASAINAFIDYKYRDQTDTKRLATNFAADVVGYTATGMAGAAVGAAVGSMTMPIIGTIVGAGVGILLGTLHDKITRPLISDALRDQLG